METVNIIFMLVLIYCLSYFLATVLFEPEDYVEINKHNNSILVTPPEAVAFVATFMILTMVGVLICVLFTSPCDIPFRYVLYALGFSVWSALVVYTHILVWVNQYVDEITPNGYKRVIRH